MGKVIKVVGEMIVHIVFMFVFVALMIMSKTMLMQIFSVAMVAIWGVILGLDIARLIMKIINKKKEMNK